MAFPDTAAWENWLAAEHGNSPGVWLKIAKKGAPEPTVGYRDALEAALCYGWIDGQKRALDAHHWLQRFGPRRAGSNWSKINTQTAEALIAAGRMHPAGLLEINAAKADGRWAAAYQSQSSIEVPVDLRRALDANPAANAFFETLTRVNRYAILYRITTVKRAETRARKVKQYVAMLADHKTIYPQG